MSEPRPTKLYQALLLALGEMGPVLKNASNPAFRSKYADLGAVLDAVDEPLHKHGLIVLQRLGVSLDPTDLPLLTTALIHAESGEIIECCVRVVSKDPSDPQKFGGALTYYRRYSLLALLGLAPEDDDGNAASQPPRPPARANAPVASPQPRTATEAPAVVSQVAMPAPRLLTDAEFKRVMEQAWTLVEDGKTHAEIVSFVRANRPSFTTEQTETSVDEVKLMRKACVERDKERQPAAFAG